MEKKLKKVPVYSMEVMMKLVRMGYNVCSIADNNQNPIYKVFFFESSPELLRDLNNYNK